MKHAERLSGLQANIAAFAKKLDLAVKETPELGPYELIVIFGYRSLAEQERLYNQGRTMPGPIVTNAKPGNSAHNWHCAVDLWLVGKATGEIDWSVQSIANKRFLSLYHTLVHEEQDLVYGGNWPTLRDYPHVEWKYWRSVRSGKLTIQTYQPA